MLCKTNLKVGAYVTISAGGGTGVTNITCPTAGSSSSAQK